MKKNETFSATKPSQNKSEAQNITRVGQKMLARNPSLRIFVMRYQYSAFIPRALSLALEKYYSIHSHTFDSGKAPACFVLSSFYIVGIISSTAFSFSIYSQTNVFYLIFPTVSSFDCRKSSPSFLKILLTRWVCCGGLKENAEKTRSIMINEGKRRQNIFLRFIGEMTHNQLRAYKFI